MKLEEVLPALRQGAQLRLNGVTFYLTDEGLRVFANDVGTVESSSLTAFTAKEINSNEFEIVLPQRVGGDLELVLGVLAAGRGDQRVEAHALRPARRPARSSRGRSAARSARSGCAAP